MGQEQKWWPLLVNKIASPCCWLPPTLSAHCFICLFCFRITYIPMQMFPPLKLCKKNKQSCLKAPASIYLCYLLWLCYSALLTILSQLSNFLWSLSQGCIAGPYQILALDPWSTNRQNHGKQWSYRGFTQRSIWTISKRSLKRKTEKLLDVPTVFLYLYQIACVRARIRKFESVICQT